MAIPFPSEAWVEALRDQLNRSASYAEIAKNWEGDLLFQIEGLDHGAPPELLYLDLWHGQCRAARRVTGGAVPKAAFRLRAPLENFVRILRGDLDPLQAMATGRLKVQGNMAMLMKNIPTVLEFVRHCQQIDTEFPE